MFIAAYVRPTKDEKNNEELFFTMTDFVKQRGWECDVFFEKTTPHNTRPVKRLLLQQLRNKKYEGLLVRSFNEWANSLTGLILEIFELVKKGVSVYSISDAVSFEKSDQNHAFKTLFVLYQFEKQIIDAKRKEAIEAYKSSGKKLGRPKGSKDRQKRKTQGYYLREDIKKTQEPSTLKRAYPNLI